MIQGFERFIAWRYLTGGGKTTRWGTLAFGILFMALGLGVVLWSFHIPPPKHFYFVGDDLVQPKEPFLWRVQLTFAVIEFVIVAFNSFRIVSLWRWSKREKQHWHWRVQLIIIAVAAVIAAGTFAGVGRVPPGMNWPKIIGSVGAGLIILGACVSFFGVLYMFFSIFTTISTYGVFLGTAALIVVLSVMNGFAVDLRKKILGSNAHILVSKADGRFEDYERVRREVLAVPGVRGASPLVQSEVVVSSPSNYQGVILRGIDPDTIATVTDLGKNMVEPRGVPAKKVLEDLSPPAGWEEGGPELPDPDEIDTPSAPSGPGKQGTGDGEQGTGNGLKPEGKKHPVGKQHGDPKPMGIGDIADGYEALAAPDGGAADDLYVDDDPDHQPDMPPPMRAPSAEATLPGVIIGRELAKNLGNVEVGDELTIVSTIPSLAIDRATPNSRPFRIAGIFFSGMYEYDTKHVYVTIPVAQSFLRMRGEGKDPAVTSVEIKVDNIEKTGPVVKALQERLGAAYKVQDWQSINRNLFSALKLEKIAMFIVLTIIILVASFSIISNLIMVVVEKAREIAILKSMGASDSSVLRIFIYEGVYIGLIGMLGGITFGVIGCVALSKFGLPLDPEVYYIDKLPVALEPMAVLAVAGAALAISFLATLYPSWVAARLRPVEGMRYE